MDNTRFEHDLQRTLEEIMQSYLTPSNVSAFNRRNRQSNTRSNNGYLDNMNLVNTLSEVMNGYNSNMYHYQSNMQTYLQIMQSIVSDRVRQSRINTTPVVPLTVPNAGRRNVDPVFHATQINSDRLFRDTQLFSYFIYPFGDLSGNFTRQPSMRNVVVAPTEQQINQSTTNLIYSNHLQLSNTNCPITLEEFQEGDNVRQIRHCGHTFREHAIQNWFRQNVRCPVCRYDIRDYVEPIDISNNSLPRTSLQNSLNNIESTIAQNISDSLSSILRNYSQEIFDMSRNLLYEFEYEPFE
jgi:hypothetical protein